MKINLFLAFSLISLASITCAENKIKVTGIYSDLKFHDGTGDVVGTEIIIGYSSKGYWISFQYSEGEPTFPIIVLASINKGKITFKVPSEINEFNGEISSDGWLVGEFDGNKQKIILQRGKSYWQ
ncbi:hypothetical protein OUL80_003196 [Salmonella enterica subsp. enterica serovar Tees]|nr:hypothetical protein [Salmonella enterica]